MFTIQGIETLEELHQSDSSVVYRGMDIQTREKVAVKMLKDEFPSLQNIARFNEEYEITNKFNIEGIRKAIAKRKVQNRHTLILEYLDGVTLRSLIDQHKIDLNKFLDLSILIARIISDIHRFNIVHKDINPKNIIVQPDGGVKIIDFGIATLIRREVHKPSSPEVLEGTLAYISPEQTGRMNRSVDYRTDLYSLGVTFYEMLTGKIPFDSQDAMELVHSHIARIPVAPCEVNPGIPEPLSHIVLKLLAKNAEDRYQSAVGLKIDLERCRDEWRSTGRIEPFEPGKADIFDHFRIPEKLYGRDEESRMLLDSFDRVSGGAIELMLVAGYSGIGKTAIINEVHKPITEKKGYFISGKFEQFQRDIPYSAIIQALNNFVTQILSEAPGRIAAWRDKILEGVGANGQVIVDVIPNLELIIGKQPDIIPLGPAETQNRFNLVFQHFIRTISRHDHPLVMFIDDWQWADLSSLNFLKLIMTDRGNQYLMTIGAYRDNEVNSSHPFRLAVEDIKKNGASIHELMLTPLSREHINELIADTLRTERWRTEDLADVIYKKTGGNPFFTNQFFSALYEDQLIRFNYETHRWEWELSQIEDLGITNNVVELMMSKIQKLKVETQRVVELAACIGNQFALNTLASINGKSQKKTLDELWDAVEEGLIIPFSGSHSVVEDTMIIDSRVIFKFLHDRVEQAAYSLISKDEQKKIRLEIARTLTAHQHREVADDHLFDVVNYYNSAVELIGDRNEKQTVLELNLKAARKAKQATAYQSALKYARAGVAILSEDSWTTDYQHTYDLYKECAEAEYFNGNFDTAHELCDLLLHRANTTLEKARLYKLIALQFEIRAMFRESIHASMEGLKLLGIHLPETAAEQQAAFQADVVTIEEQMQGRRIAELIDLPVSQDAEFIEAMQILKKLFSPAYMVGELTLVLLSCARMVALSLIRNENSPESPWGYVSHATFVSSGQSRFEEGYQWGKMGLELNDRFNNLPLKGSLNHLMGTFIASWRIPFKETQFYLLEAYKYAAMMGDFPYAGYATVVDPRERFQEGMPLLQYVEYCKKAYDRLETVGMGEMSGVGPMLKVIQQTAKALMGQTVDRVSMDDDTFSEANYLGIYGNFPIYEAVRLPLVTFLHLHFEQYDKALEVAESADKVIISLFGGTWSALHNWTYSFALINNYENAPVEHRRKYLDRIRELQNQMQIWAENAPANFKHLYLFIEAELAIVEDRVVDAMNLFKKAIQQVQEAGFINDEALIRERAGRFYLRLDQVEFAQVHLAKAYYAYQIWGATAKARFLQEKYTNLVQVFRSEAPGMVDVTTLSSLNSNPLHHTSTGRTGGLDFQSVMKAAQAISREIRIDKLMTRMMRILIENAGAERGLIVQEQPDALMIAAEGTASSEHVEVLKKVPTGETAHLPLAIIRFVERTKEILVLNDASRDKRFNNDTYVQSHQVKSVLCAPIIHQGQARAVIYLENNLAANVFTPDRINVIAMLSGQMSISLENAVLYDNLEQKVTERTAELNEKNIELNEKNEQLYNQNIRITDSIRYAERIQQAILPTPKEMSEHFADYFVLYKPKDIVSGDFFWIKRMEERVFIAVVDCTGHGVPGAFMSMIGNTLLDEIVTGKRASSPAQALEMLDNMIRTGLKQTESENSDGMDICLCMLRRDESGGIEVTYAGAKRPLYYVKDGNFGQLDAQRRSIGGMFYDVYGEFENHTIHLHRGDLLYLTTDGFADQANARRSSFGSAALKELFRNNACLELTVQKEILEKALHEHQQDTPQRDDITIVGLKL